MVISLLRMSAARCACRGQNIRFTICDVTGEQPSHSSRSTGAIGRRPNVSNTNGKRCSASRVEQTSHAATHKRRQHTFMLPPLLPFSHTMGTAAPASLGLAPRARWSVGAERLYDLSSDSRRDLTLRPGRARADDVLTVTVVRPVQGNISLPT